MAQDIADRAYEAAVYQIHRVRSAGRYFNLDLSGEAYRALNVIPKEIDALPRLLALNLSQTGIIDLSPLASLTDLQKLSLDQTAVADLAPLASITALQALSLKRTPVADFSPLATLTALQTLSLDQTAVADLAPLASLTALQTLSLKQTPVADFTPLASLTALQRLWLDQTTVADLTPLAGLTALQILSLSGTAVAELAPLSNLTALLILLLKETDVVELSPIAGIVSLSTLDLDGSRTSDLRPICSLANLSQRKKDMVYRRWTGLSFRDTPATATDAELARLAEIKDAEARTRETLAYLNTLPPWPEPLPWQPPPALPDTPPLPPDPDQVPQVDISPQGLDLAASPIDPLDLTDPIKARLYAKLPEAVATLLRHGNRYPEVAGPAKELADLTSVPFNAAELLDIHLQLAALTDLRTADADRPKLEQLDPDCRLALDAVLRIGPGVTLGHPNVDALEERLASYARRRQPATVAEGERQVTGALAGNAGLATPRLRKVAGQVAQAGDEGRIAGYRRGLSRNVIIALGAVASGVTDAAQGYVYGEIVIAAAQFLVLHRDAIMATAPAWGQTGYAWLEYILVRADLILKETRQKS